MRFSNLLFILLITASLSGQSTLTGTKWSPKADMKDLDNYFEHYTLYKMNVKKSEVDINGDNPFLNLELEDKLYELNLFQDNLAVSAE